MSIAARAGPLAHRNGTRSFDLSLADELFLALYRAPSPVHNGLLQFFFPPPTIRVRPRSFVSSFLSRARARILGQSSENLRVHGRFARPMPPLALALFGLPPYIYIHIREHVYREARAHVYGQLRAPTLLEGEHCAVRLLHLSLSLFLSSVR